MTSRRVRNSATMAATPSWGPSRAAISAYWLNAEVQETELIASLVTGSTSAVGKTPKPSRQPVMAYVFDQPSSRMVRSAMPSNSSTLACGSPYRSAQYTSSDSTTRSCRKASAAIAAQSSTVSAEPHGLCGELMISSFDAGVISRASSSTSMRHQLACRSGTGTGVAPANAVIDSYIGNPGSG